MADYSTQQPDRLAATSPWTRPPEEPTPYRLTARLSDMLHGWLDGKHGIPLLRDGQIVLTDEPADPATGSSAADQPDEQGDAMPATGAEEPAVAGPATETDQLVQAMSGPSSEPWTPRMEVLVRLSREHIENERIQLSGDLPELRRRTAEAQQSLDSLSAEIATRKLALDEARKPLQGADLARRRLAERDTQRRPAGLVSDRRQAAWDRQLSSAQDRHQSTAARYAQAQQAVQLGERLIDERIAVAKAAARRQHELAMRRVATYLQQLVRTHDQGPELNALLMNYRVGPDLPDWVKDPDETSGQ